jgi:hypothetical protein
MRDPLRPRDPDCSHAWMLALGLGLLLVGPAHAATRYFTDVTADAGVAYEHGWVDPNFGFSSARPSSLVASGVAAGDYDGDGWIDLYVVRGDIGPNLLFRNRGDGRFEEVGAAAGVALTGTRGSGPTFADVDGDGHLDLLVLGMGLDAGALTRPTLFRNRGDGTFADVTAASGITSNRDAVSSAFGDYDRDGDLDVFITHWGDDVPPGATQQLWRNTGNGTFTDASAAAGIAPTYLVPDTGNIRDLSFAANFADIDNDGWPDLLVAGDFRTSQVFRNNRNGTFTNITDPAVITDENGMGAAVGDYDGDGNLDWFVSSIWDPDQDSMGNNWLVSGNRLYRGRGDGTFEDATDRAGVRAGYWGWAATFADLDNDGHLDLYHTNGWSRADPKAYEFHFDPARAFISNGDGTFAERSTALGLDDTLPSRGVVAFDYDRDGDVDLFVTSNQGPSRLYRNDGGNHDHWLTVKLRGRAPNREAIGARVRVTAGGQSQLRELRAGSNFVSQDPAEAHFGLGTSRTVTLEVIWPDGARSVRDPVAVNQRLVLDQPPPGVDEQTKAQRDCIVALNAAGAKLVAAAGDRLVACVEAGTARTLPAGETAEACLAGDASGRIAAARARIEAVTQRRCSLAPTFGPASAADTSAALGGVLRARDVFGPDLAAALVDARLDPIGARCQVAVAHGMAKLARAQVKAFNACKKAGLKAGTIRSAAHLTGCYAATSGPAVLGSAARARRQARQRCTDVDLAAAFPGRCRGARLDGLFACLEEQASCGVCLALNAADRLAQPCHRFADGVATVYCGDRPVTDQTIARQWNEELLGAIRRDTPRPTVHARNLYHLSAAMWDAWRAYGGGGSPWLTDESHATDDAARDRTTAISFAAYRLLAARFQGGPGALVTQAALRARLYALGFDVAFAATDGAAPAAVGNRIAAAVLSHGLTDGANEEGNYADPTYAPVNPPLVVKLPGTTMSDPNRWQPLALDLIVTQNNIPLPDKVQAIVGPSWNRVKPFALTRDDPDEVYIDPGPPPQLGGTDDAAYKESARRIVELSSWLDPTDGVLVDISPGVRGNNPLGTNDGTGHAVNPVTGQLYAPNVVPRGDFARVLAEYWADGPESETPPGHWNVIANEVSDAIAELRIGGSGPALDRLEWDVKLYLTLNGAVHDAAVVAWGLKRKYDSVRPISMVRHLAGRGQSSDSGGPAYAPDGIPLEPGLIEVITAASTAPGQPHEGLAGHEGEIAIRAWGGPPADARQRAGVHWMRAVEWMPYQRRTFVTPAFPGFTSGHSTFSRAAAEVMTRFTGSAFVPGGLGEFHAAADAYLGTERGPSVDVVLQWATYYDAADLAGQSRLVGGIHVSADDFNGRIAGAQVGNGAFERAMEYFASLDGSGGAR